MYVSVCRSKNLFNPEWFRDLPISAKREFGSIQKKVMGASSKDNKQLLKYISLSQLLSYLNVTVRTCKMYSMVDREVHDTLSKEQLMMIQKTMIIVMKGPAIFKPFALKQLLYIIHERTLSVKVYFRFIVTTEWTETEMEGLGDNEYQTHLIQAMKRTKEDSTHSVISIKEMKEIVMEKIHNDFRSSEKGEI